MCGIFGAIIIKPTEKDLKAIEGLFLSMESRGTHASGCAWVKDGMVHIEKEGIPAHLFVDCVLRLDQMINEDGNLYMLGHTRYTTSDIFDHQPIGTESHAIAHNGIVTLRPKSEWRKAFRLKTETANDSELLFALQHQRHIHPLQYKRFNDSTIAVVELTSNGSLIGYRNFGRPLWQAYKPGKYAVFSSTGESLVQVGFQNAVSCESYVETQYNVYPQLDGKIHMHTEVFERVFEDLEDYGDK